MGIVLDIIIIAIIVITAFLSAKRGFVRTAVELVGFGLAIYLAFTLSTPASSYIYKNWVEPSVVKSVEESITQASGNIHSAALNALPDFIENNLDKFGVDPTSVGTGVSGTAQQVAQNLSKTVTEPILTGIFRTVLAIILFIALTFIVRIVARLLNKLFSFSIVGKLNKTLGFILGSVKGVVFAAIFCALVVLIASFAGKGFLIFSTKAVNSSFICSWITDITGMNFFKI